MIEAVVRERDSDPLLDLTRWMRATGASLPSVAIGSAGFTRTEAMPADPSEAASLVNSLVDEGVRLLFLDLPETAVVDRALIALLTSRDAGRVAPEYRPGLDAVEAWRDSVAAIAHRIWASRELTQQMPTLAREVGAVRVDVATQILLAAAQRSTPVVISGVAAAAAALIAQRMEHRSAGWLAAATRPVDPATAAAQERLALTWVIGARISDELQSSDLAVAHAHLVALMAL